MNSTTLTQSLWDEIQQKAFQLGFDRLALTKPKISSRDQNAYLSWCQEGMAGPMNYMTEGQGRRLQVDQTFPGIQSVISVGVNYYQGPFPDKPGRDFGRVSRYAWGLDYHDVFMGRLQKFVKEIEELLDDSLGVQVAVDTKPLLERALGAAAGLGFVGKNTLLIIPRSLNGNGNGTNLGSWIFLGEIFLSLPLADDVALSESRAGCGSCTRCVGACPTDALKNPYRLNATRCISYLTIENKGWIPEPLRQAVGDWLFGCDLCQDICPYNARVPQTTWKEFSGEAGTGAWIPLRDVLTLPEGPFFKNRWGKTPIARAKRKGLIRNACVVAGNSEDESIIPDLKTCLQDSEPLIRGHALWALSKLLGDRDRRLVAEETLNTDTDSNVREECLSVLG